MMLTITRPKGQPRSPGVPRTKKLKVCVMSLAKLDRFVPAFLLFLGFVAAGGTAGLGI
jgi:hypothetical protein